LITFLASPKAFSGIAHQNQFNAIQSWRHVHPAAEVILYGNAPGCREVCTTLGIAHVDTIECSPSGVPYFGAIANHARQHARYDIQVYLNCDILLSDRILDAVRAVTFPKFLIVGQRIDLWEAADVCFQSNGWASYLEALNEDSGARLHPPSGVDYFIFSRGLWEGLKPLVIGRAGYDSALLAFCLRRGIPVIDATYVIPALHPYHDYGHVKGKEAEVMAGVDARQNRLLHGVVHSSPNIVDATWRIIGGRLARNRSRGDYLRQVETFLRFRMKLVGPSYGIRALWRVLTGLKIYKPRQVELSDVLKEIYGE
jgi:hypothetical protein